MLKKLREQRGMEIVEATFVFPIIFFVVFFLIYMGNVYYVKAMADKTVTECAIKGAALCADPLLDDVNAVGVPGTSGGMNIEPYRYLTGRKAVESAMKKELTEKLRKNGNGLFGGMAARNVTCTADFENYVLYYTFTAEADYSVKIPLRFMGTDPPVLLRLTSRTQVPVSDAAEFINNVNMALDYYESSGVAAKVNEAIGKVKEFFSFGSFKD